MTEVIIVVAIPILSIAISLLGSKGQGFFDQRRKWFRVVTKKGWWVILLNLIIISLVVIQFNYNEQRERRKDLLLSQEQARRDSLIQDGIAKGNERTFEMLSIALAKQNLKLDTFQNTVSRISNKRNIIQTTPSPEPVVEVYVSKGKNEKGDDLIIGKAWTSYAPATVDNLEYWLVGVDQKNKLELIRYSGNLKNHEIKKDDTIYNYTVINNLTKYEGVAVYFKGNYSSRTSGKKFPIEVAQYYNRQMDISYPLADDLRNNIKTFLNQE